jgi:CDP-glucose 4,6-dehydratase
MDRRYWHGRKVLLTGHTGFKGSWLSLWLTRLGADVCGYALLPPTQPNLFERAQVARGMKSVTGDVRDYAALKATIANHAPEIILHLAAQSVVKVGYRDPIETYSTNVMGTCNVLQAVRELGRPCVVVNVTTDKVYENQEWVWGYRENERLGGFDPYSNSKACSELVTQSFRDSFFRPEDFSRHGVAVATARAGNVIGGGDWTPHQLIPDIVQSFQRGTPVTIRSPSAIRPWQFVLEPLRGYLHLAEYLARDPLRFTGGWNFGPDEADEQPVSWIVDRLVERWQHDASWKLDAEAHPHEAGLMKLDITKARTLLGWSPAVSLATALDWIVEWHRAAGELTRATTEAQIGRYEELVWRQP